MPSSLGFCCLCSWSCLLPSGYFWCYLASLSLSGACPSCESVILWSWMCQNTWGVKLQLWCELCGIWSSSGALVSGTGLIYFSVIYFFILFLSFIGNPQPSPPNSAFTSPFHCFLPFSWEKGKPLFVYRPTLGPLGPARLSTFSPTEAQSGSPGRGRESNVRQQSHPLQLLQNQHEDEAVYLIKMYSVFRSSRACCLVGSFFCELPWTQITSVGPFMVSLTPFGSLNSIYHTLLWVSWALPDVWMWVCASVSMWCWMKPLRRQLW